MDSKLGIRFNNLSDDILNTALLFPDKYAFIYPTKITYKVFWEYIVNLSSGFEEKGIRKGVKTIVLLKPGIALFATVFALLRIGSIPILIDPGMGVNNMLKSLKLVKPKAFIGTNKAMILRVYSFSILSNVSIWISGNHVKKRINKSTGIRSLDNSKYKYNLDDNAAIFFTSGSTGPAKAVLYSNRMLTSQISILKDQFDYKSDDIDLCTFPLVSLLLLTLGISVAIADMNMLKPAQLKPARLVSNINDLQCTSMFCSPLVLKKVSDYCNSNNVRLLGLRKVLSSGAPVKPTLLKEFRNVISERCRVYTPYGATEALPITNICDDELLLKYDKDLSYINGICVGKPLKGIEVIIIRIDDKPIRHINEIEVCDENVVGEIIVSGGNVTQEYYLNDDANSLSKIILDNKRAFHRMGDLGRIDNEGNIWFYGRKSQRVDSNNKIYYTIPVEAVFNKHPKISRSALVSVITFDNQVIEPVICLELKSEYNKSNKEIILEELKEMGLIHDETNDISTFIFISEFPVDPRHNAKIFREKLAIIAYERLKSNI